MKGGAKKNSRSPKIEKWSFSDLHRVPPGQRGKRKLSIIGSTFQEIDKKDINMMKNSITNEKVKEFWKDCL